MNLHPSVFTHNTNGEVHSEVYVLYADNGRSVRFCAVCGYTEE